ncbi:oligosaccharide flippase family protein [Novosphingobium sp. KCTC 2891]|uniref:lipopolysaccharide biosynthesis protein n=1 Tax=Novosphingobium sp. KCTC 2891 TaxID=2989730 RepID=UPI0022221BE5|nr:oligosaccharide flippase family protein [Novosphingobium sp. KCTC 2891]MCW1382495.1 oligosaccharide flippase family protein [Novosphingobium sp. KCTC 2891]
MAEAAAIPPSRTGEQQDIAALAKGGRTNFLGFLLRLAARIPFLFIAGRLYGADDLGRFASATIAVELAAQLATLGQKRGLAQQLAKDDRPGACIVADALLLSGVVSAIFAAILYAFPAPMFPSGEFTALQRLLPLTILPLALGDIALAALAYKFDVGATVRARAVVEPWTLSIVAGGLWLAGMWYLPLRESGLILSYVASMVGAMATAFVPLVKSYGLPRQWSPRPGDLLRLANRNLPLAGADAVEWGTRKLDIFILGTFAPPSAVGIYYVAQQVASLPQKLKTSFEPILGPVITRNLKERNYDAIARQVCQVGFWIIAAQAGIALALGIPGRGVMGLVGPNFVAGTGALALLLAAEVVAATAVVSEAALIYVARMRNLWISLGTIALQGALTVGLMLLARRGGAGPLLEAEAAAFALAVTLGLSSLLKSRLLGRILGQSINNWRWALVWAAVPACMVGYLVKFLPEWAELSLGIPAILGVYCYVIWRRGFGPEDRMLFRKQAA